MTAAPLGAPALVAAATATAAQPAIVATTLVYFAACVAIGLWAARRTRTARDFFVAGDGVGVVPMAIASMAATLSGFAFVGGPGLVHRMGVGAVWIILPASITTTLGALVLARPLRRLAERRGVLTIPAALAARYDSPLVQGASAVAIILAVVGYTAGNLLALGIVLDAIFGVGRATGVTVGALLTIGYSAAGGIVAGIYTDLLQGALMALSSALVFAAVLATGGGVAGMSSAILAADPAWISPWGTAAPLTAIGFFFVFGVGTLGQPHVVHKFLMLRDLRQLRWYPLAMSAALGVSLLLFVGVGLAMKALVVQGAEPPLAHPDDATPRFLLGHVPLAVAALVFAGIAAAIMSTVNAFLNVGAAALAHDLPAAVGRPLREALGAARLATVGLGLAATATAIASDAMVAFLGIFGWGLFASTLVPALAVGLHWPGATRHGAAASVLVGLTATIGLELAVYTKRLALPAGLSISGVTLVASFATLLGVSWATRHRADAAPSPARRAVLET